MLETNNMEKLEFIFLLNESWLQLQVCCLFDPVQVVDHLGVDPRLVGPPTAVPPGDDAQESVGAPAGADHGSPAVPLAAVHPPGQVAGTEHPRGELVRPVHRPLHAPAGLQDGDGGGLEPPGVPPTGLARAAPTAINY